MLRFKFNTMSRFIASMAMVATLAGGLVALSSAPASATSLTNVNWLVGNNATSTTNAPATTNTGVYTWTFTTSTALISGAGTVTGALSQITATVPSTTVGTLTLASSFGLGSCTIGTPTVSSGTVTIPVTTCSAATPAGTTIQLQVSGFSNPTAAGSSTSVVTIGTGSPVAAGDTGTSGSQSFNSNTTAINIVVPDSLTLTNNKPATISLTPVPGAAGIESNPGTLVVATNANGGYYLSGCSSALSNGSATIPLTALVDQATFLAQATSGWGAEAAVTGGAASLQGSWSATSYFGYGTTCGSSAAKIMADTGPTAGDTLTLTNGAAVSPTQASGTYTGSINYQVTPHF